MKYTNFKLTMGFPKLWLILFASLKDIVIRNSSLLFGSSANWENLLHFLYKPSFKYVNFILQQWRSLKADASYTQAFYWLFFQRVKKQKQQGVAIKEKLVGYE